MRSFQDAKEELELRETRGSPLFYFYTFDVTCPYIVDCLDLIISFGKGRYAAFDFFVVPGEYLRIYILTVAQEADPALSSVCPEPLPFHCNCCPRPGFFRAFFNVGRKDFYAFCVTLTDSINRFDIVGASGELRYTAADGLVVP